MKTNYWFLALVLVGLSGITFGASKNLSLPTDPPSSKEKEAKYAYLKAHRVEHPVKPSWYPVHIFRNATLTNNTLIGSWNSSGTVLMQGDVPVWLVTAAHCFREDGMYHITILTPALKQTIWAVESVERSTPTNDIAMAKIGTVARHISSIWSESTNTDRKNYAFVSRLKNPIPTRSLITGETFHIIGQIQYQKNGAYFYVLDYDTVKAESGAGFDAGNQLFVINKWIVLDIDQQRTLGIDPRGGYFSLVTGIQLTWPQ